MVKEIYFQKRKYSKNEIAEILGLNSANKNFARQVRARMSNLGFEEGEDYSYVRGGEVIILWVPTAASEKIQYLVRLLGIDSRVDVRAFSIFTYLLMRGLDIQGMPWQEKADYINFNYDLQISEKTLRTWTNKLIALNVVQKDTTEFKWWCSARVNGELIRYEVETEEQKQELEEYRSFMRGFYERGEKVEFSKIWSKFGCKYYRCYNFVFGAWNCQVIEELLNVVEEYIDEEWN